jgi:hypothetical protein
MAKSKVATNFLPDMESVRSRPNAHTNSLALLYILCLSKDGRQTDFSYILGDQSLAYRLLSISIPVNFFWGGGGNTFNIEFHVMLKKLLIGV